VSQDVVLVEDAEIQWAEGETPPRRVSRRSHVWAAVLVALALISVLLLTGVASSPQVIGGIQETLDGQQATVSTLAASATALSAGLSLVPEDALGSVADKLAEVSGWFVVIIASIIFQKILVTVSGTVAFGFIIPLACALGVVYIYSRRPGLRSLSLRFAALGLVICFAVPASILSSSALTTTYAEVEEASAAAAEAEEEAEAALERAEAAAQAESDTGGPNAGVLESIGEWFSDAAGNVGNAIGGALNALNDIKDDAVAALNSYTEKFALLVVTACIMPLVVMAFLAWVIKLLFGVNLDVIRAGQALQSATKHGVRSVRGLRSANRSEERAAILEDRA
jgi:predicted PurR-regulated permease PerM